VSQQRRGWVSWSLAAAFLAVAWVGYLFSEKLAFSLAHLLAYVLLVDAFLAFLRARRGGAQ